MGGISTDMAYISGDQGIKVVKSSRKEILHSYQIEHFAHPNDLDGTQGIHEEKGSNSGGGHISPPQGKQEGDPEINAGNRQCIIGFHQNKFSATLFCQEITGIRMNHSGIDKKRSWNLIHI
jgi:hypothetical protein